MNIGLKLIIIVILSGGLSSCTKKDQIYQGVYQGIYEISNQAQEIKDPEKTQVFDVPTYYQYKTARDEMLTDSKNSDSQQ